jgi:hypothetical protein
MIRHPVLHSTHVPMIILKDPTAPRARSAVVNDNILPPTGSNPRRINLPLNFRDKHVLRRLGRLWRRSRQIPGRR